MLNAVLKINENGETVWKKRVKSNKLFVAQTVFKAFLCFSFKKLIWYKNMGDTFFSDAY